MSEARASRSHLLEELFLLTAMPCLAGAFLWAALRPETLTGHYYQLPTFGLVHVLTLGWFSLMILGVMVRLVPMHLRVPPPGRRLGFILYGLWVLGASGTIVHMVRGEWFGVWTAAAGLGVAALLLPFWLRALVREAGKGDWTARYAVVAMGNLFLAALVGIFIALNKHLGLVAIPADRILAAHVHLGALGWVTLVILGFGRRLHPPLAAESKASAVRLGCLEGGLVLLVLGLLFAGPMVPVGAGLVAGSLLLHLGRPLRRLVGGKVRDRASFWVSMALVLLLVTTFLGFLLGTGVAARLPVPVDRLRFAYGWIAFVGWTVLAITSFALKIFPVWVWEERFGRDLGLRPVPAMQSLYRHSLQHATGALLTLGAVVGAAGMILGNALITTAGVRLAALGVFCFLANFALLARWGLTRWRYRPSPEDVARFEEVYGKKSEEDEA